MAVLPGKGEIGILVCFFISYQRIGIVLVAVLGAPRYLRYHCSECLPSKLRVIRSLALLSHI